MGKVFAILLILFLGLIAYLGFLNQEEIAIKLTKNNIYEIPMVMFIMISSFMGAFLVFVFYTIRDTKRFIKNMKMQKTQKHKERLQSLYNEAISAFYAQKPEIATRKLEELLALEPSNVQALLKLAEILFNEKKYNDALEYYRKIIALETDNIGARLKMAEINIIQRGYDEALRYLDEVLKMEPLNRVAIIEKRNVLEIQGRWHDLMELQKDILKHMNNNKRKSEERRLLGYTYEEAKRLLESGELDKAKKMFKSILKNSNTFVPAHIGISEVLLKQSHPKDAINYLEKTFEETGSLIILARLEDIILGEEDPSRIISIYKKALSMRPDDNTIKYLLIKLYYRLEMLDDALEMIEGIEDQRLDGELKKIRAAISMKRGHYEEAATLFSEIIDMKRALKLPLCCSECGKLSDNWQGRCPFCGNWNSLDLNIYGVCDVKRNIS